MSFFLFRNEKKIILHYSSSLRDQNSKDHSSSVKKLPSNWLIFEELSKMGIHYTIKSCTNISPITVALFTDMNNLNSKFITSDKNVAELILNNWINFEGNFQTLKLIFDLREKLNNLVIKKILYPQKNNSGPDDKLIDLVANVLLREDHNLNFFQPDGIGQRPKTFLITNYPMVNNVIKKNKNRPPEVTNDNFVPEILKFKPIQTNSYNKYLPHFVNANLSLEPPNLLYDSESFLSQNLLMMNLYNKPLSDFYQNPFTDFDLNGINVNDDFSEGACALPTQKLPHWLNNFDPNQTSYFIIKAGGLKSIDISISKKTWIFSPQTERKLLRLLHVSI